MNDTLELLGMLTLSAILIVLVILFVAAVFAAPGYVVLMIIDHESIGFWNSAATGLGSIILGGLVASMVATARGK